MPAPTKGPRLGSGPAHERLMVGNLATALFEHGRIKTTEAKARRLRPVAERLITFAKRGDLAARRRVLTVVRDKSVVHTLFTEIGPRYENRPGGYTRTTKLGHRKGDNAPMVIIELVEALTVAQQAVGEAERARGTTFSAGKKGEAAKAPAAAVPAAAATTDDEDADADTVAAETGDSGAAPDPAAAQAGEVTEAQEGGDQAAEGATSEQTASATDLEQAEGEPDKA